MNDILPTTAPLYDTLYLNLMRGDLAPLLTISLISQLTVSLIHPAHLPPFPASPPSPPSPPHPPTHPPSLLLQHDSHPTIPRLLARAADQRAEVADGNLQREVEAGEHDGEEEVPAGEGGDEGECAAGLFGFGFGLKKLGGKGKGRFGIKMGGRREEGGAYNKTSRGPGRRGQIRLVLVVEGEVEVGAGEAAECADEGEEDGDEDDVCA